MIIEQRFLGPVRQVHAPDGDRDHFGAGSGMAARHLLKAAIFAGADEKPRLKYAIGDPQYIACIFPVYDAPAGLTSNFDV